MGSCPDTEIDPESQFIVGQICAKIKPLITRIQHLNLIIMD